MSDTSALKVQLQAAILAALAREGISLEGGVTAEVVSPILGEMVIALTPDS